MCPTTLDEEGMVSAETRVARVRVGYRRLALRCCIPPAMCFNTSRLEISYSTKCADVKILLLDQGQWCGTARSNSLWVDRVRVGVRWPTQHSISGGNQYQQSSPTDLRFLKKKYTNSVTREPGKLPCVGSSCGLLPPTWRQKPADSTPTLHNSTIFLVAATMIQLRLRRRKHDPTRPSDRSHFAHEGG